MLKLLVSYRLINLVQRLSTVGQLDHTEDNVDLCSDPVDRPRAPLKPLQLNLLEWFDRQAIHCHDEPTPARKMEVDDAPQHCVEPHVGRYAHSAGGPDYTEDNSDLCSGRHNLPGGMSVQTYPSKMRPATDVDTPCPLLSLHHAMTQLCTHNWTGLNTDFSQLSIQHPAARCALEVQQGYSLSQSALHIYTDGSCKGQEAAWAFVVVAQVPSVQGPSFWKIGFAADILDDAVWAFSVYSHGCGGYSYHCCC